MTEYAAQAMAALVILALPLAAHVHPRADVTWFDAPPVAYLFPLIGLLMAPIYPVLNSVMLSALPKDRHAGMTNMAPSVPCGTSMS